MKLEAVIPRGAVPPAAGPGSPVAPVQPAEPVRAVSSAVETAALVAEGELATALRRELPRQGNPMPLLANLAWLNATPDGAQAVLPAAVRESVGALWRALASLDGIAGPGELERAVLASGLRLERLLATTDPSVLGDSLAGDWKALLLRLRAALAAVPRRPGHSGQPLAEAPLPGRPGALPALEPSDPTLAALSDGASMAAELADEADAAIARVTCNQLASLREPGQPACFVLEVPLRHDGDATMLRLRCKSEHAGGDPATQRWTAEFAVHLGADGTLQGRVALAAGRLDVAVECDRAELLAALRSAEAELRWQLESLGLEVERLGWRMASSPLPDPGASWLVDERA